MSNTAVFKILTHSERVNQLAKTHNCDPISIEIDPTNACNHRCTFCCTLKFNRADLCTLEYPVLEKVLQDLAKRGTVQSVVWKGGGEPTIYPHLESCIQKAAELGLAQALTTNGTKLNSVLEVGTKHLSWTRISLDAATMETHDKIHGSVDFESILIQIRRFVQAERKGTVGLNMTVVQVNLDEIEKFVLLGLNLGVDYVAIRPAYYECFGFDNPISEAERDIINKRLKALKTIPTGKMRVVVGQMANAGKVGSYVPNLCLAPALRPVIGADGELYPCCDLRGHKEYSFGNIKEQNFWEIWDSEYRKQMFDRTMNKECLAHCSFPYDFYNQALDYLGDKNKIDTAFL